jgi:hypothetical protein
MVCQDDCEDLKEEFSFVKFSYTIVISHHASSIQNEFPCMEVDSANYWNNAVIIAYRKKNFRNTDKIDTLKHYNEENSVPIEFKKSDLQKYLNIKEKLYVGCRVEIEY